MMQLLQEIGRYVFIDPDLGGVETLLVLDLIFGIDAARKHAVRRDILHEAFQIVSVQPYGVQPPGRGRMVRLRLAQGFQGLHEAVFPGLVVVMDNAPPGGVPIEEPAGSVPVRQRFGPLAGQDIFHRPDSIFSEPPFPGQLVKHAGRPGHIGTVLAFGGHGSMTASAALFQLGEPQPGEPLHRRVIILDGDFRQFPPEPFVSLQFHRRISLYPRKDEILQGARMDLQVPSAGVIDGSDDPVRPEVGPPAQDPVAATQPGAQDVVQPPQALLLETAGQVVEPPLLRFQRSLQQGIGDFPCLKRLLGLVPGIVPSAVQRDNAAGIRGVQVGMAGSMLGRDRVSAPFTEQEVERSPGGLQPEIPVDMEGRGHSFSHPQTVLSRFAEGGKIHLLEASHRGIDLPDCPGEHPFPAVGIFQIESAMMARDGREGRLLSLGRVARCAVNDSFCAGNPALDHLGIRHFLQRNGIDVETQGVAHRLLPAEHLDGKGQLGDPVAGEARDFQETLVPLLVPEVQLMVAFPSIGIRDFHGAVILQIQVQIDAPRPGAGRIDEKVEPVALFPVLPGQFQGGQAGSPSESPVRHAFGMRRGLQPEAVTAVLAAQVRQSHASHSFVRPAAQAFHVTKDAAGKNPLGAECALQPPFRMERERGMDISALPDLFQKGRVHLGRSPSGNTQKQTGAGQPAA